jgi:hypothetical protein
MGRGPGRPKTVIDWELIGRLATIHCTETEIASVLDKTIETMARRAPKELGMTLGEYIRGKKEGGRASLRRKQWDMAMKGDRALIIFLGKNYLGQSDRYEQRIEQTVTHNADTQAQVKELWADIERLIRAKEARTLEHEVLAPPTGLLQ